jgi:hypothetical protein
MQRSTIASTRLYSASRFGMRSCSYFIANAWNSTQAQLDNSTGAFLNELASDGETPTGLAEFDLNSPEDDPVDYGPYPINRMVLVSRAASRHPYLFASRCRVLLATSRWWCKTAHLA